MFAVVIEGGKLAWRERPDPVPGDDELLVAVRAAGVNRADLAQAKGQYPAPPGYPQDIPGLELAGEVLSVGSRVTRYAPGDRIMALVGGGAQATLATVPEGHALPVPPRLSWAEAGGFPEVFFTAFDALFPQAGLALGERVLVTGANGGVGTAAVQLAAALGHKVVALSRSLEKSRRLEQLGAAATFNPEDPRWNLTLKNTLAPRRVDLAIDNVGGKLLPQVIDTLGDLGRVSVVGRLAGPVPSFNTAMLFFRRIRLGGVAVGAWTNAESRAAWREVLSLLSRSGARPQVDQIFPFEQLPQAFQRLAQGPMGKVLLAVRSAG